jgi:hypothetical protein
MLTDLDSNGFETTFGAALKNVYCIFVRLLMVLEGIPLVATWGD